MNESGPFEMPRWDLCPFCENVAGRNQCAIIEDRPATLAFINPRQSTKGATLVMPKHHTPTVLDLSEDDAALVMQCVVRVARAITQTFNPAGINILQGLTEPRQFARC